MNVFFKLMQKDDKKEVLKFEIKGNEDGEAEGELFDLSGSIVALTMSVGGDFIVENLPAEFLSMQRDSKKTAMKFAIKGDSEEQAQKLYKFAGRNVGLEVLPSQMSIDDFHKEPREGVRGKINGDGTVDVDDNQLSIDDAAKAADEAAAAQEDSGEGTYTEISDKITDIANKRKKKQETESDDELELLPPVTDDLPF